MRLDKPNLGTTITALHGFTGGPLDFAPLIRSLRYEFKTPRLFGHGPVAFNGSNSISDELNAFWRRLDGWISEADVLLGYSMGARLAIHRMLSQNVRPKKALIFVSGSAGLGGESERNKRYLQDCDRASQIMRQGVSKFLSAWQNTPLIRTQQVVTGTQSEEMMTERRLHTPAGLAHAVRCLSPGILPEYWSTLSRLDIPTLLVVGETDSKYRLLATRMSKSLPKAEELIIASAGHAPHIEAPAMTAQGINSFISRVIGRS